MNFATEDFATDVAFILVGGRGTRLQALFPDTAKPLVPLAGRPFLDRLLSRLSAWGVRRVTLLAGYRGADFLAYKEAASDFGLSEIDVLVEPEALGSAGAVGWAWSRGSMDGVEQVLVINGDTHITGEPIPLLRHRVCETRPYALGLCYKDPADRYGLVRLGKNSSIEEFLEKRPQTRGWVNAGYMMLHRTLLDRLPADRFASLEKDFYPHIAGDGVRLESDFLDYGTVEDFPWVNADLLLQDLQGKLSSLIPFAMTRLRGGRIFVRGAARLLAALEASGWDVGGFEDPTQIAPADAVVLQARDAAELLNLTRKCSASLIALDGHPEWVTQGLCDFIFPASDLPDAAGWAKLSAQVYPLSSGDPWRRSLAPAHAPGGPALFLDRDGTVMDLVSYIQDPEQVKLRAGSAELIREACRRGWRVIGVTNQSGLGREYFGLAAYHRVNDRLRELLAEKGAFFDEVLFAPAYEKSRRALGHLLPAWRKPRPGMLVEAARRWGVDLSRSVMIGDSLLDLQAGLLAGVPHVRHVQGHQKPPSDPRIGLEDLELTLGSYASLASLQDFEWGDL